MDRFPCHQPARQSAVDERTLVPHDTAGSTLSAPCRLTMRLRRQQGPGATTERPGSLVDQFVRGPGHVAHVAVRLGNNSYLTGLDLPVGVPRQGVRPRPVQPQNAWVDGGSPTNGFLSNAPTSPFENIYKDLAGATWADWLFMIGLLLIGVALILGVGSGSSPSPARCSSFSCGLLYCLRRTTRSWMTT
jgi:hypothetical protein